MDDFFTYIKEHKKRIDSTARAIQYHNTEYKVEDIKCMVKTAIWENLHEEKPITMKGIGFEVLNRIFEEKGIKYNKGELLKPVSIVEGMFLPAPKRENYDRLLDTLLVLCKLTQEEIFVVTLFYGLDTPASLQGEYKEIVDQLRDKIYYNPLSYEQIGKILNKPKKHINKVNTTAWRKFNAIKRDSRPRSH